MNNSSQLRSQKNKATFLLIIAFILFCLSSYYIDIANMKYLKSFSEAAVVGGIADWFAITALFKRPLSLPLPHTAIIPRNKDRIIKQISNFFTGQFLTNKTVPKWLYQKKPVHLLVSYLNNPKNIKQISLIILKEIQTFGKNLNHATIKNLQVKITNKLVTPDKVGNLSANLINILLSKNYQDKVLDLVLINTLNFIKQNENQDSIKKNIKQYIKLIDKEKSRNFILNALSKVPGGFIESGIDYFEDQTKEYAINKLINGTIKYLEEILDNPNHPFREFFTKELVNHSEQLRYDQAKQLSLCKLVQKSLLSDEITNTLINTIKNIDIQDSSDNNLLLIINKSLSKIVNKLNQAKTLDNFEIHLYSLLSNNLSKMKYAIDKIIVTKLGGWNEEEISTQIEKYIGKDLQYIRINGTLIGGLIGLCLAFIPDLIKYFFN